MPLSEQEQRLLDEMERSLYQNDADFVATVTPRRGRPNYQSIAIGVLIGVVGVVALLAGVIVRQPLIGLLGFAVMFTGVLIALSPSRSGRTAAPRTTGRPTKRAGSSSFMDSMNDRWDRRQDGRG